MALNQYKIIVSRLQRAQIDVTADDGDHAQRVAEHELGRLYSQLTGWRTVGTDVNIIAIGPDTAAIADRSASGVQPYLLSTKTAAEYLSISRTSLYALMKAGEIETVQIGRRRFISHDQLMSFIARAARDQAAR